jgi:hypothetical protein
VAVRAAPHGTARVVRRGLEEDAVDHEDRALIEEGFLEWSSSAVELRLGWDSLTWGAASTLNIIDVINTRSLVEGVIDAPKLGQPMLAMRLPYGNHSLSLLYLTPFMPSQMPRLDSAFVPFALGPRPPGVPLPELGRDIRYGGRGDQWHPQAAADRMEDRLPRQERRREQVHLDAIFREQAAAGTLPPQAPVHVPGRQIAGLVSAEPVFA